MNIKNIISHFMTIFIILGVSLGIWYMVDTQLTDSATFDVPVVIQLPPSLKANWIITEKSNPIIKATFEGPKETISTVMQKQKEISAFIDVDASQLVSDNESEINFSRTIKDISFETQEGKISESIEVSLKEITEITFKVAPTKVSSLQVYNNDVLAAFENIPDEKDYQIFIENIEPNNIYVRAPANAKIAGSDTIFDKVSLANIKGRGIETRKYTRRIPIKYSQNSPLVQFFADQGLTNQIAYCEVTFGFEYKNIKTKTLTQVPVNIVLPAWCIENFVAVYPQNFEIQEITIRGREDILQQLNNTNVVILFMVSEGGIDKKNLKNKGDTVITASTRYKLYIDPTVVPLTSAANIEIVKGDFTQGKSIQLQKFDE